MKVVTLNTMLVCIGPFGLLESAPDLEQRALGIGRWLRAENPDVACLQEVFQREHLDVITSQWPAPSVCFGPAGSGLAILSRWPLSPARFAPFRWQASFLRECQRVVLRMMKGPLSAFVATDEGTALVATCHLLPRYPGIAGFADPADAITPERNANTLELLDMLRAETASGPANAVILAGDFNMNQRSIDYAFFERMSGMTNALRTRTSDAAWGDSCTYCGENRYVRAQGNQGEGVLDHVMLSPDDFEIEDAHIEKAAGEFTDHSALVATVHLRAHTHGLAHAPLPPFEVQELLRYFKTVRPHPLVYLGPLTGWRQRARILAYLEGVG